MMKIEKMFMLVLFFGSLMHQGTSLPHHPYRTTLQDKLRSRLEIEIALLTPDPKSFPLAHWIDQPLDHFNAYVNESWKQRYFVNDTFFNGSGPVFLCCGGEGPAFKPIVAVTGDVHCGLMMTLAKKHGALVFAVEHRYYGLSVPVPDLSTENLQWLSTSQALEDLANFIAQQIEAHSLTAANKWVTWGGSYPGMVAGWMRLKYPHLVHASVASSAPLRAVLNYQGFNDVVAQSLSKDHVGGSQHCLDAVKTAFSSLGSQLGQGLMRRRMETKFNVCHLSKNPLDLANNRKLFMEVAAEVFPIQGNDQSCQQTACNIAKVCRVMLDASLGDPLDRLAALNNELRAGECLDASFEDSMVGLIDTTLAENVDDRARVWFYQTCTEYGFYQTCDPSSQCPFTSSPWMNTLESWTDQCKIAYNINPDQVEAGVQASNIRYGGDRPAGSRILFVNAEIDPWNAASVLVSPNKGEPELFVRGASHHQWTHPPKSTDTPEVIKVRLDIADQLSKWLLEEDSSMKNKNKIFQS